MIFAGGALIQRTPVGKKRKDVDPATSVEPPMTRHRAQVLASGEPSLIVWLKTFD